MKAIIFEYGKKTKTFDFAENVEYENVLKQLKTYFGINMAATIVLENVNTGRVIVVSSIGDLLVSTTETIPKYKIISSGKKNSLKPNRNNRNGTILVFY